MQKQTETDSIPKADKPRKRRLYAFTFFLIVSSVLWLFVKLADTYSVVLPLKIQITDPQPEYWISEQQAGQLVNATVSSKGFKLLTFYASGFNKQHINVPLGQVTLRKQNQNTFYITSLSLKSYLASVLGLDEDEIMLADGDLYFNMETLTEKKVPVVVNHSIQFIEQFGLYGKIQTSPDSIGVLAPSSVLDTIRFVATESYSATGISSTFTKTIALTYNPALLHLKQTTVDATFEVERFTESVATIKINKPGGLRMRLFPSETKITFSVAMKDFHTISPDQFYLEPDTTGLSTRIKFLGIKVIQKPEKVSITRIEPDQLEYIFVK